jgi:hypothetical protein
VKIPPNLKEYTIKGATFRYAPGIGWQIMVFNPLMLIGGNMAYGWELVGVKAEWENWLNKETLLRPTMPVELSEHRLTLLRAT